MSRYHLVLEALRRSRRVPEGGDRLARLCRDQLDRHRSHVVEAAEDLPEVRSWTWGRPDSLLPAGAPMSTHAPSVVVGVDGSEPAAEAARAAAREADQRRWPLRLVRAFAWPAGDAGRAARLLRRLRRLPALGERRPGTAAARPRRPAPGVDDQRGAAGRPAGDGAVPGGAPRGPARRRRQRPDLGQRRHARLGRRVGRRDRAVPGAGAPRPQPAAAPAARRAGRGGRRARQRRGAGRRRRRGATGGTRRSPWCTPGGS